MRRITALSLLFNAVLLIAGGVWFFARVRVAAPAGGPQPHGVVFVTPVAAHSEEPATSGPSSPPMPAGSVAPPGSRAVSPAPARSPVAPQTSSPLAPAGATQGGGPSNSPPQAQDPATSPAYAAHSGRAALPLALSPLPASIQITPEQKAALEKIQKDFVKAVGGADQNPSDPAYEDRWNRAMSLSDQRLRSLIGWTAFNQWQMSTWSTALNPPAEVLVH